MANRNKLFQDFGVQTEDELDAIFAQMRRLTNKEWMRDRLMRGNPELYREFVRGEGPFIPAEGRKTKNGD